MYNIREYFAVVILTYTMNVYMYIYIYNELFSVKKAKQALKHV